MGKPGFVSLSLVLMRLLMIAIFVIWVALWVLKPTEFWTRKWKKAEQKASSTVLGYNGLNFVVYTFPLMVLAAIGLLCVEFKQRESTSRRQQGRHAFIDRLSDPLLVNSYIGVLSGLQILTSSLFIAFLIWTFYARVSNDFKKMTPNKLFKLSPWQYKLLMLAGRCGLLSEACLALLLLPVLRGISLFRILGIQFEASIRYHIWLGNAMVFLATLHGSGNLFVWGIKHRVQEEIWKWQRKGRINLAGAMALAVALIMWITALPPIRRNHFRLFYYTHHLYVCFIVLFLFHGGDRHFYMVFPGVFLFALDKLLRVITSYSGTCILSARIFPCKAIELMLPKEPRLKYMPTSVIFLKIPTISRFEWHPFSITSSSSVDEDTISVVIKCEGEWTNSLQHIIRMENDLEVNQKKCIPIATEGPYGPNSLDFIRYNNMLLIAGGIGVTPFLSIIREITSDSMHAKNDYSGRVQLVYTTKQSQDVCLLDSILPQLLDFKQCHLKLKVFVTRENPIAGTTLRELLIDTIPKTEVKNFSTACANHAAYGLEGWVQMAATTIVSSVVFVLSLVCFNYFVVPPSKTEKKRSSSQIDLILMFCFAAAIACSAFVILMVRLRRLRKETQSLSEIERKSLTLSSIGVSKDFDEHEIYFGPRPDFGDVVSNFGNECGRDSDIGVLVCGPESMKESVAIACRGAHENSKGNKLHFNFHSLNFTL